MTLRKKGGASPSKNFQKKRRKSHLEKIKRLPREGDLFVPGKRTKRAWLLKKRYSPPVKIKGPFPFAGGRKHSPLLGEEKGGHSPGGLHFSLVGNRIKKEGGRQI